MSREKKNQYVNKFSINLDKMSRYGDILIFKLLKWDFIN